MVFENTSEVIRAENILKKTGRSVSVMGPPPEIRTGCDLVIEFPLIEELELTRELSVNNIFPIKTVPVGSGLLEPVSLFHDLVHVDLRIRKQGPGVGRPGEILEIGDDLLDPGG